MLKLPKTAIIKANTKSANNNANEIWYKPKIRENTTDNISAATKSTRKQISTSLVRRNPLKFAALCCVSNNKGPIDINVTVTIQLQLV